MYIKDSFVENCSGDCSTRKKTECCLKDNIIINKSNTCKKMVLLLQDDFIMFQLRVKKQCCSLLIPVCLVFEIHHDFCQNRGNSTELKIF